MKLSLNDIEQLMLAVYSGRAPGNILQLISNLENKNSLFILFLISYLLFDISVLLFNINVNFCKCLELKLLFSSLIVRLSMLYTLFITFKCSFLESRKCSIRRFGGVLQFFFLNMYVSIDISRYDCLSYHIFYHLFHIKFLQILKIMFSFILYITCTFSYF